MPTIGISGFVRRQTPESEYTHYAGYLDEVAKQAAYFFDDAKPGYRDGVVLVPVNPVGFFTPVVYLESGDKLVGEYKARRPGEEPRKTLHVIRQLRKRPAIAVDVVLYRKDVLEEGDEPTTGKDWDIVSINGRITKEDQPIHPDTLIANHFQLDGGTATGMSPAEFEAALRESVMYWKDKALVSGGESYG